MCPNGYFNVTNSIVNQSKYVCSACLPQCLTCATSTSCILCKVGVQFGGSCLTKCPAGMFAESGTCFVCTLPCVECVTATVCSTCPTSGYLLVAGSSCIVSSVCPEGYFLNPNSTNCTSACGSGLYKSSTNRLCVSTCPDNQFKTTDMECVESCPSGYYGDSTYNCVKCASQSQSTCQGTLNFNLSSEIVEDLLFVYMRFSMSAQLVRQIQFTDIQLTPDIPFDLVAN